MSITIKRYDRYASIYDLINYIPERAVLAKLRKHILSSLRGVILEVGAGTGLNFPHYPKHTEVIAIDASPKMLRMAKRRLEKLGRSNIVVVGGDVEQLPFAGGTFDGVVATCVFCSVEHPVQGLGEIKRVLKPKGKAVLLEHVRSESRLTAAIQDIFNPLVVRLGGFNVNRRTRDNIIRSTLRIVKDRKLAMRDVLRLFVCAK